MGFLKGKTAIITGGRSVLKDGSCGSIGCGIATAYAKEGANLVITGRVCVQLASPDFKYMNGETLTLEGGMGLRP